MNCCGDILIGGLSDIIVCGGKTYAVNTDFKIILDILHKAETGSSLAELAPLFFSGEIPTNPGDAMEKFIGREYLPAPNSVFSFFYDAGFIIGAFMECYNIDLLECDMHWKKFTALFMSLNGKTAFSQLIRCRCADFSDPASRTAARRISAKYDRRFLDI